MPRFLLGAGIALVVAVASIPVWPAMLDDGVPESDVEPQDLDVPESLREFQRLQECVAGLEPPRSPAPSASDPKPVQVRALARQVEEIRELRFDRQVEARFLSPRKVSSRIGRLARQGYTKAKAELDERALRAIKAITGPQNLREVIVETQESQVIGFYIPETEELVVRTTDVTRLGPVDRVTLAHELEHALADQNFDLDVNTGTDPEMSDRDLAYLSLVEGDATLTMQQYMVTALDLAEQLELTSDPNIAASETQVERIPYFIRQNLLFPYVGGLSFVCNLYANGGWKAVNRAYADPPRTTLEVLHPFRYDQGFKAIDPRDPPELGGDWRHRYVTGFGAAELKWLLEAPAGDPSRAVPDVAEAVEGWSGGEAHLYTKGPRTALGIALNDSSGNFVMCEGVRAWYEAAWPVGTETEVRSDEEFAIDNFVQTAVLRCPEDEVRLGIAPDFATARRLTR